MDKLYLKAIMMANRWLMMAIDGKYTGDWPEGKTYAEAAKKAMKANNVKSLKTYENSRKNISLRLPANRPYSMKEVYLEPTPYESICQTANAGSPMYANVAVMTNPAKLVLVITSVYQYTDKKSNTTKTYIVGYDVEGFIYTIDVDAIVRLKAFDMPTMPLFVNMFKSFAKLYGELTSLEKVLTTQKINGKVASSSDIARAGSKYRLAQQGLANAKLQLAQMRSDYGISSAKWNSGVQLVGVTHEQQ